MKKINSLKELKKLCKTDYREFFIAIGPILRTSKTILYIPGEDLFVINHEINGSIEELTTKEIMDPGITNIGTAITRGAFYMY